MMGFMASLAEAERIKNIKERYGSLSDQKALAFNFFKRRKPNEGNDKTDWQQAGQVVDEEKKRLELSHILAELEKRDGG